MRPKGLLAGSSKSLLLAFILFSHALAQNSNASASTNTAADGKSETSTPSPSRTVASTPPPSRTATISTTPSKDDSTSSKLASSSTDSPTPITPLPALTSTSATSSDDLGGLLTGLPKLPGDDYPPPTVPPTANAPFMRKKSSLPEGTVFICVGAVLGFMALVVMTWRGLVAWSLHRSVRRAALAQSAKYNGGGRGVNVTKSSRRKSSARYYNSGPGSTLSLEHLGASGRGGRKSTAAARESLFYSPTAGVGTQNTTRGSAYLPAGYYAAGNSAAGGGPGMSHLGDIRSSFTKLGHPGHGYSRARSLGPSPPGSPSLPPSRGGDVGGNGNNGLRRPGPGGGLTMQASNSSLNLSVAPQSRAPSAYLDELFENHRPADNRL